MDFSIIFPTRERTQLLADFLQSLQDTTADKPNLEVLAAYDTDDTPTHDLVQHLMNSYHWFKAHGRARARNISRDYHNWLRDMTTGKYIIICNDDTLMKTQNWDTIAKNKIDAYLDDKPDRIFYGWLSDSLTKREGNVNYCCFPMLSREAMNALGYLMHPNCSGWGADIHLYNIFASLGRILDLSEVWIDHLSYHCGKRERDNTSHNMQRISYSGRPGQNENITGHHEEAKRLRSFMKLRLALVTGRWCDLDTAHGESSANSNLLGSLQTAGLQAKEFYYDDYLYQHGQTIDEHFLNYCRSARPSAIIINYYPLHTTANLSDDTLQQVKNTGIPMVFIWFDYVSPAIQEVANRLLPFATLNIAVDTPFTPFLPMWVPQDERLFGLTNTDRDIPVSFVGSRYPERQRYLDHLLAHAPLQISGGQRDHRLSIQDYASLLQRSKMTINFSRNQSNLIQAKCRIYEAMLCGTMLLEEENDCIKHWFTPMQHYVPFANHQDLADKVNYYLNHEQERVDISQAGWQKMVDTYNSATWWDRVLNNIWKDGWSNHV